MNTPHSIAQSAEALQARGIAHATAEDLRDLAGRLANMNEQDLRAYAADQQAPYLGRSIAEHILANDDALGALTRILGAMDNEARESIAERMRTL